MRTLRAAWEGAEQWIEPYNALLAAGMANADAEIMRAELDDLFKDIIGAIENKAHANALRHRRSWTAHPTDIVEDMHLLYRWISRR